ncbi:MAG: GspE/PulE family protein [Gemmatimonadaceae bacterium]
MADRLVTRLPVADVFAAEYLKHYGVLPLARDADTLRVARVGDADPDVIAHLELTFGGRASCIDVTDAELDQAITTAYVPAGSALSLRAQTTDEADDNDSAAVADARELASQPPVIRLVNVLIRDALRARASDLHFEATRDGLVVRIRVDGVMSVLGSPPKTYQSAIISRLKLLAELNIAEHRRPQDGRIRLRLDDAELDVRVSTVPTLLGESVAVRLLNTSTKPFGLEVLGMSPDVQRQLSQFATQIDGLVLATGPTGSGKTTTLHVALTLRPIDREKVITVEDPVEILIPGITQVPVTAAAGVTFASVLRSILRQDPDAVMVGEMRDAETARIATQAALTGHLVLSTLHTNDAASAITRLVDIGLEPFIIASTLRCVVAQRLVRQVCVHCKQRGVGRQLIPSWNKSGWQEVTLWFKGSGCERCRGTGFHGRTGIYELMPVTSTMRMLIRGSADASEIASVARQAGTRMLSEDAFDKVVDGITTPEEVRRVLGDSEV